MAHSYSPITHCTRSLVFETTPKTWKLTVTAKVMINVDKMKTDTKTHTKTPRQTARALRSSPSSPPSRSGVEWIPHPELAFDTTQTHSWLHTQLNIRFNIGEFVERI
ncbi:hypothetical protein M758_7G143200 [Ceratodon purpureus]|nr:hypothetical protein M758_7G143200 [Ceratodon purpureus]